MKFLALTVALLILAFGTAQLAPPTKSYKILMLLPMSSRSHRNLFIPLAEDLAARGHKITMLANAPPAMKHENIVEYEHGISELKLDEFNAFEKNMDADEIMELFVQMLTAMAHKMYKVPIIANLYAKRKDFDLVIVDGMFNEPAYPFLHEMTFILLQTTNIDHRTSAAMGNVLNPSTTSTLFNSVRLPMTFIERAQNLFLHFAVAFKWRHWAVVPSVQKEITEQFPSLPSLLEIERNVSLQFINSHFSLDMAHPMLPNQVEIGGIHCHPGKPLPKDLQSFIDGAGKDGVIFFSLGSLAKGSNMPQKYVDIFVRVFSQLKMRVVWKFEQDLPGLSKNVMLGKWLPQQDILAHPNVKVFITHGGLLSTTESIYHGTPLIALPIFGDQPKNAEHIVNKNFGAQILWEDLTEDSLKATLQEVLNNPKYNAAVTEASSALRDQPQSPRQRAVFWTEYVLRHGGAPLLRSPAMQLSWVEYLMLDALAVLVATLLAVIWLLWCTWKFGKGLLCSKCVAKSQPSRKKNKKE